ncbi:MAG: amidohydrolase [Bacteroidales bacterium]|nr:amidohydrolase [Bacteroidales bacterium]
MATMTKDYRNALTAMRRHLHKHPETAHQEKATSDYVADFLSQFDPDKIIRKIGGNGLAAVFSGNKKGPVVMIRAELDALPLKEENQLAYRSAYSDRGHLCGHDGHMTMVAGLAPLISASKPGRGRVVLFFQPAEETGEGARKSIEDEKFKEIEPDYVYALHNLPGYEKSSVVLKRDVFASASKGLIIKLEGASSHAGHPEGGNNPSVATGLILQSVLSIPQRKVPLHESVLITPIHLRVGRPAFGTSPGEGELMFTLRAHSNEIMETMEKAILKEVREIAKSHDLSFNYSWTEPFEVVKNDGNCVDMINKCAENLDLTIVNREIPFPWSEDFGVFTSRYPGALFGLGAGKNTPQLHHPNYNFPDDILEKGTLLFYQIIAGHLND